MESLIRLGFEPDDAVVVLRSGAMGVREGDDHKRVRRLAAVVLTKRRMDAIRPLIRRVAHELIDDKAATGELEVIEDYAIPLPKLVMMEFLGLDEDEWDQTLNSTMASGLIDAFSPTRKLTPELREMGNQFAERAMANTEALYEARRQNPRGDLLSDIVQAEVEQGHLSVTERVNLFTAFFGAGTSTASIISSGILELARHPDQAELLRGDPERWKPGASEESLRYHPAINQIAQRAAAPVAAFDQEWEKDDVIIVLLGAVNRDPTRWENPDTFDIRRDPATSSLTFGIGAHLCLGHAMARATIEEALAVLVERCTDLTLLVEPRRVPFVMENKLESLPIRFRSL